MSLNKEWIQTGDGWDDGYYSCTVINEYKHQRAPFEGHYPNKNEAKVLRRIMAQTGLTEKEVRGIKKYRRMLAEAGKTKELGYMDKAIKEAKRLLKHVTQDMKLPKEHPSVIEEYYRRMEANRYGRYGQAKHFQVTHEYACGQVTQR